MKVSKEELLRTAELANLKIDNSKIKSFKADLEDFLTFTKQLDELDLSSVLPTSSTVSFENHLREDIKMPSLDKNSVLINAKNSDGNGIIVPKILE